MEIKQKDEEVKTSQTEEAPSSEAPSQENDGATDGGSEKQEEKVDYKAELEKIRKEKTEVEDRLKKAEYTLYKKNKEEKQSRQTTEFRKDEEDDGEAKVDLEERVAQMLEKAREEQRLIQAADNVELEIDQYSDDPDRQALIRYHYENTINRRGYSRADIKKDLEVAAFLADRPKFEARMAEVNKAIVAEQTKKKGGIASGVRTGADTVGNVELSAKDKQLLQRHGLTEKDVINNLNK